MTNRSIARRYARALLDVARKEADPEVVEREIGEMADVINSHADLRRVLANPAVPTPRKRAAVAALLDQAPSMSAPVSKLLLLLAERDRLGLLGEIRDAYGEDVLAYRHIVRAEVTTAVPLSAERAEALARGLSRTTGKRVTLSATVDPTIVGGVVARIGSVVYDGSVTRQLERLKATLSGE